MALSDELRKKIGQSTSKGTKITKSLVDKVANDEENVRVIEDNTQAVVEKINSAAIHGLYEIGQVATTYAKMICPVDTGRLKNSITFVLDEGNLEVYIGTNVEYAKYQENGPRAANKGRGFLRPAATEHANEYRSILRRHFENA